MVEMPETQTVAVSTAGSSDSSGGVREGDGLGLGLPQKMARTGTFPFRIVPSHLFQSNSVGPTLYNGSDCSRLSDLYDVGGTATVAAAAAGGARVLQPFPFKSPGVGGMAASLRFPFTSAQWQELERQALIYKYMIASIPVPPELLFPINPRNCNSFSDAAAARTNLVGRGSPYINLRFSNGPDPEPTRCRRTDGKKWRCSRDVAPDQKYCERHMHRGRPRSRKPVEVEDQKHHNRPTTAATAASAAIPATNAKAPLCNLTTTTTAAASSHNQTSGFFGKPEIKLPFQTMAELTEPRFLDQMASNQQWELMHPKVGVRVDCSGSTNGPAFQLYDDHLNLNFTNFGNVASGLQQNDQCCLFLNTDLSSLEDPDAGRRSPPRHFIDAWSVGGRGDLNTDNPNNNNSEKSPIASGGELAISSLTLSMSGDMDQIHMGLGISDSERDNVSVKSHPLSWMSSVPWQSPPSLGGPLGEVLQSSTVAGSNSASSPHGCSSSRSSCGGLNLMSDGWVEAASPRDRPPLKLDSSPTRVLQKTLASLSDCSSSSSPTFAAAKSEIALQWLSQSRLSSS